MEASENDSIELSKHLLASLFDRIPKIQTFKGKWLLIKSKLSNLEIQLSDLGDFPGFSSNPLSIELVSSVSKTLNDVVLLAEKCQRVDLAEGKLKTQSEIDSVLAKLEKHVKDSEILIVSGVLQDGVVLNSSRKEVVRAEARNLVTRLQIGDTESKNSAMDSFLGLIQESDRNVMIAVAQGVVSVLLRLLDSNSPEMREKAVAAISRVSMVESSKNVLIAEGLMLLNQLLRILESGSGFAKEKACIALQALSFSTENARTIGCRGGISSLLQICQAGTPNSQAFAAGVLKNLAACCEIRENFREENAVSVLLALASSGTALAQENAISCLANLLSGDESLKLLVARNGGIECLKNFWDSSPTYKSLEVAAEFLSHLSSCPPIAEVLVSEGFIPRVAPVLNCSVLEARIAAANSVYELSFTSKTRREIGECGCVVALIKMLDGKGIEEKEAAAKALSTLMSFHKNRKILRKEERGIANIVQLMDPSIQNLNKKYLVSILLELVHSKNCRKQMVAAGACVHLQKLVEINVEGAKKLYESLGRGKIWSVFARQ